jgi:predicted translin family RNA/ssDNA-binding protein
MSIETILEEIRIELMEKDKVRETFQKDMRKATRLSKQAILLIHQRRVKDAITLLGKAGEISSVPRHYL